MSLDLHAVVNFSEISHGIGSCVVRRQQPPAQVSTSEINHAAA